MMSENWQDWNSPEYMEFLERFYKMQLTLAFNIADGFRENKLYASIATAVFEKLATPAVYLKAEYAKWKTKRGDDKFTDAHSTERQPTQRVETEDRWKQTKTEGTLWMSERDASEEELTRAMDPNSKDTWYMKPREGYESGAIFKKVKA